MSSTDDTWPNSLKLKYEGEIQELRKRVERGDPIAIYEALLRSAEPEGELHDWLVDCLLRLVADYHLGKKPKWKGQGMKPLSVVRKRIEDDVRRRAVKGVRAWLQDKSCFNEMPTRCIELWIEQQVEHRKFKCTLEEAYKFAAVGLKGIKISEAHQPLKCSRSTLKRLHAGRQNAPALPPLPGRIVDLFGLQNPDGLFGTSATVPRGLL